MGLALLAAALCLFSTPADAGRCDGSQRGKWTGIVPNCLLPGEKYRILFVTFDFPTWATIGHTPSTLNKFVQRQADDNDLLVPIADSFRVLGSHADGTSARENTNTEGDGDGIRIFYFWGDMVAGSYADLYDGAWASHAATSQSGHQYGGAELDLIMTGTNSSGTGGSWPYNLHGNDNIHAGNSRQSGKELNDGRTAYHRQGRPIGQEGSAGNGGAGRRHGTGRVYALSGVFHINRPATGRPSVSGTPGLGEMLSASPGTITDPDGLTDPPQFRYQWEQSDVGKDTGWDPIANATGETFTVGRAQAGRKLRVRVDFTDAEGHGERRRSLVTGRVSNVVTLERTDGSGPVAEGDTVLWRLWRIGDLSQSSGHVSVRYRTSREGTIVSEETCEALPTAGSGGEGTGRTIGISIDFPPTTTVWRDDFIVCDDTQPEPEESVWVVIDEASLPSGYVIDPDYAAFEIVIPASDGYQNTPAEGAPSIDDPMPVSGQTLAAGTEGISDDNGLSDPGWSYQWQHSGTGGAYTDIAGATSGTFTVTDTQLGRALRVRVRFTDDHGNEESLTSEATAAVQETPPVLELSLTTDAVGPVLEGGTFTVTATRSAGGHGVAVPVAVAAPVVFGAGESGTGASGEICAEDGTELAGAVAVEIPAGQATGTETFAVCDDEVAEARGSAWLRLGALPAGYEDATADNLRIDLERSDVTVSVTLGGSDYAEAEEPESHRGAGAQVVPVFRVDVALSEDLFLRPELVTLGGEGSAQVGECSDALDAEGDGAVDIELHPTRTVRIAAGAQASSGAADSVYEDGAPAGGYLLRLCGDEAVEMAEWVSVHVAEAGLAARGLKRSRWPLEFAILDGDTATLSFAGPEGPVAEGESAELTVSIDKYVSLPGAEGQTLGVRWTASGASPDDDLGSAEGELAFAVNTAPGDNDQPLSIEVMADGDPQAESYTLALGELRLPDGLYPEQVDASAAYALTIAGSDDPVEPEPAPVRVVATTPERLSEDALRGGAATMTVELAEGHFVDTEALAPAHFSFDLEGLSVAPEGAAREADGTRAVLTLAYTGDLDAPAQAVTVTVAGAAHTGSEADLDSLPVTVEDVSPPTVTFEGPSRVKGAAFWWIRFSEPLAVAPGRGDVSVEGGEVEGALYIGSQNRAVGFYMKPTRSDDGELVVTVGAGRTLHDRSGNALAPVQYTVVYDTTAPVLVSAEASRTSVTLHYDEPLDEGSLSALTNSSLLNATFEVTEWTWSGRQHSLVSGVEVAGTTVVLTLVSAIDPARDVRVSYTPPASSPLRDVVGNVAGAVDGATAHPAALSVADARADENSDAHLVFEVRLEGEASGPVTVDYTTRDGSARAGEDYTRTTGTLTFEAGGEMLRQVEVPILRDAKDEGEETLTLELSNAQGAALEDAVATGIIENHDPLPQAWLARFGRTVASQVVEAVSARRAGGNEMRVVVGGQTLDPSAWQGEGEALVRRSPGDAHDPFADPFDETRSLTMRELMLGSAFQVGTGTEGGGAPAWTAWGRFATGGFDADDEGLSLEGDVTTGLLGADVSGERWLAGLALSVSEGDGPFRLTEHGVDAHRGCGESGRMESALTGVYPYARASLSERMDVWGVLGRGTGELTYEEDGCASPARLETDITMTMGAVGTRGEVLRAPEGGFGLAVKSDVMWVRTESDAVSGAQGRLAASEADVSRLRLALEGSRSFELEGGGRLTLTGEAGLRHDGGDAETGTGLEVGGGLRFEARSLSVEGALRGLVAHEQSGYEEWGASGAVRLAPDDSGRGLSFTLAPSWGAASSEVEQLWSLRDARGLARGEGFEAEARVRAELGYGLGLGSGALATPYSALELTGGEAWSARLGVRSTLAPGLDLGVEGARRVSSDGDAEHALTLRLGVSF